MRAKHSQNRLFWNPPFLVLTCLMQAIYGVLAVGIAVMLSAVVDAVSNAHSIREILAAGVPAVCFAAAFAASRAAADSLNQVYAEKAAATLRQDINHSLLSMNVETFSMQDSGEYIHLLTADAALVRDQYYVQIPQMVGYISQFVACVLYSMTLSPVIAGVLTVMSVVQYFVPTLFGKHINVLTANQSAESARFTSKIKEIFLGFHVIKSYGAETVMQGEFEGADRYMTKAREKTAILMQVMMCSNLLIAWLMILLSVLCAGYFVIRGTMTAGGLFAVFYIANRYSMPVMDFAAALTKVRASKGIREKLNRFLQIHLTKHAFSARFPIAKGVELRNLTFSYGNDQAVLHDLSYRFERGKKYLILGESGCGKSSLLKAIAGQYPAHGVFIDGKPCAETPVGSLMLVEQQPYIFHRSIKGNIDILGTGNIPLLQQAIISCKLEKFISSLPQGIDTLIDEEKRKLSGGQKARVSLARALYAQPDVLLLDEVTSALDAETAYEVEHMILSLENVLVIHVAHKPAPSLRGLYDAVLTIQNGRIQSVLQKGVSP